MSPVQLASRVIAALEQYLRSWLATMFSNLGPSPSTLDQSQR